MLKHHYDFPFKLISEMYEMAQLLYGRLYVRFIDVKKIHEFSKGFDMFTLEASCYKNNELYRIHCKSQKSKFI